MKRVMLVGIAACAILLGGCAEVDRENPYPVSSAMHQPYAEILAKFKAHPKLSEELKKAGNSYDHMALGEGLVNKGVAKLDDASLLKMAKLIPDILEKMNQQSCGQMLKGRVVKVSTFEKLITKKQSVQQEFFGALEAVGTDKGRSYLDLIYLAVSQAVDDPYTPPAPHPAEVDAAMRNLLGGRFTEQQRNDIIGVFSKGRTAKDEDLCWAMIAMYANIAVIPSQHRRTILRWVAAG